MSFLDSIQSKEHEQVSFFREPKSGIIAVIAIHDSTLGPALGGCRMQSYQTLDDALYDVLRLSEGMSYKNSLAGLSIGGGKAVIVADREMQNGRYELFTWFGKIVTSLGGKYITAEDMGTSVADLDVSANVCPYVTGRNSEAGGGGDPSPWTALGVFGGIKACLERVYGSSTLTDRVIAVQGVGHVGSYLLRHLKEGGAKIIVSDSRPEMLKQACQEFGAETVGTEDIYSVKCDVFSPCAIGAILNNETVPRLNCRIVAGGANNQLAVPEIEKALAARGIVYAPDFAINAGGVIMCADELEEGGYKESRVRERVLRIGDTVGRVLDEAGKSKDLAGAVAIRLAKDRIAKERSL